LLFPLCYLLIPKAMPPKKQTTPATIAVVTLRCFKRPFSPSKRRASQASAAARAASPAACSIASTAAIVKSSIKMSISYSLNRSVPLSLEIGGGIVGGPPYIGIVQKLNSRTVAHIFPHFL
jgi:hypothetical protein